jgi:hypothetical protein
VLPSHAYVREEFSSDIIHFLDKNELGSSKAGCIYMLRYKDRNFNV